MMETVEPTKTSAIKIGIVVIPAILILSICIALYLGANEEEEPNRPVEGEVTIPELADYLMKLNRGIVARDFLTEEGVQGLRGTAAMVQGTLGPLNLGYRIHLNQADSEKGLLWETVWIDVGEVEGEAPVVLAIPYGESGTPVAFALGFAEYLTAHSLQVPLRIVFYPPLPGEGELKSWVEKRSGAGQLSRGFLVVRGGGPEGLWASISAPESDGAMLSGLLSKKGWEGNVVLDEEKVSQIALKLGERGRGSNEAHAQRLIRVMPLLQSLLDELAL
ncbi:hypothetical protein V2O64_05265 [Verrucomicrobiaceae bacterium 227]